MFRAVIYCRCSTEEESQQEALKKQIEEARECARNNGWLLTDEYIESKSGTTAEKRKEYRRLYEDLESDRFDIVIIKSQDRLMRNTKDWYLFVDRLVTNGRRLYMYIERKFYTADDALITGIKAILAEEYSKELSKKINLAHRNRQRQGNSFILPPDTYGYQKLPDKSIVIIEGEAEAIRLMFYLCLTMGCGRIASVLEKEGYRDRSGEAFKEETIRRIIRNPIRCGTVVQNKRHFDFQLKREQKMPEEEWIVHKDVLPAIVAPKEWEEANGAMDERAARYGAKGGDKETFHGESCKRGGYTGRFELSGKIHCGYCNGIYYRTCRRRKKDDALVIEWKCQNYVRHGRKNGGCGNIHLEEQKLLDFLENTCVAYDRIWASGYDEIMERLLTILPKGLMNQQAPERNEEIKTAIRKQEILSKKLLDKLLEEVISDDEYRKKHTEIKERLKSLHRELAACREEAKTGDTIERRIRNIVVGIKEGILHKAVLRQVAEEIQNIEVFRDKLRINFMTGVAEVPLSKEFTYAGEKETERDRILTYMRENPCITAGEIAELEKISLTTANYRIKKLRQQGKIYFNGRGGHGKWVVCESEEEK